jgi:hypothetical protein
MPTRGIDPYFRRPMQYEVYLRVRHGYVASLAHHYWKLRGCPEGSAEVDWFLAELKVDQELLLELNLGMPS